MYIVEGTMLCHYFSFGKVIDEKGNKEVFCLVVVQKKQV